MALTMWLTIATGLLLFWQFYGKKGTYWHIFRWFLIFVFSAAVVIINTLNTPTSSEIWNNVAFVFHIIFGSLFFVGLVITPVIGWKFRRNPELRPWKRLSAYSTLIFWILSMVAAVLIPLV